VADFKAAFDRTMAHEGGYVNDPDDRGGETYRGVARKFHPKWEGWSRIEEHRGGGDFPASLGSDQKLDDMVRRFYETFFWDTVKGDDIVSQAVAESIFDFGVNAGYRTSAKLAQTVAEVTVDGAIGPDSLKAINDLDERLFLSAFTVVKITRYVHLVDQRPSNRKFFYGWVRRALGGAA